MSTPVKRKRGRPPGPARETRRQIQQVRKMFQEHADEALETILSILRDDTADNSVRLKAANDLLNRGFGTPVSTQIVEQVISDEGGSVLNEAAISTAPTADLLQLAAALSQYISDQENTIDVTPTTIIPTVGDL